MKLLIPVASGAEASVKRELKRLGYGDCPASNGRISLEGGWEDVARLNLRLRGGERVLIRLAEFPANAFGDLFEGVFSVPWEEYFTPHTKIIMDGKCVRSALMAVKASGGVAKKAIVERLKAKLHVGTLDEAGERAIVGLSIFGDVASVTLDTSGDGLHKRGYRVLTGEAPLRETTAAVMIESSVFHPEKYFADLFCGGGTLPIEAALIAKGIAPGICRGFDFERWKCAPDVMPRAREEARDLVKDVRPHILAADISPKAVEAARFHARRAGVEDAIGFRVGDMRNFSAEERYGVLMSNPPYGERMGRDEDLFGLYRDFSKLFRSLPDWSCYFISGYPSAERAFGGRADKRRKFSNAGIECGFYGYLGKKPPRTDHL